VAGGLTPRQLDAELDEHGSLEAIQAAHPELADHLRDVRQAGQVVERQVRALARATESIRLPASPPLPQPPELGWFRRIASAWQDAHRFIEEWARAELVRARRAHLRVVRSDRYEQMMKRRLPPKQAEAVKLAREFVDAARDAKLSPELLAKALLLELETERSPADRRPGPKVAQVRMEESLRVAQHPARSAEAILGVSKDRAAWIRRKLGV
jgi:hypothetical protein